MQPAASLTRLTYILIAVVMLVSIIARALPGARTIDDAFITFRYSRNIVEGQGFVYNHGAHTLGTTTPLFTLIMAAISAVTGGQDFQRYAIAVSALADALTAALLLLIARRLTGSDWLGGLLGMLWSVAPRSVTFAVGGMETSVNILWMAAAVYLSTECRAPSAESRTSVLSPQSSALSSQSFSQKNSNPSASLRFDFLIGFLAGLGLLTRIDSALWIAPLFACQLIEQWRAGEHTGSPLHERLPWRTWLACVLTVAPWVVFCVFYFGSPLPNSVSAKTVAYVMPPGSALGTFITTYATPFFEFDTFGSTGAMAAAVIYLALSLLGMLYTAKRLPRLLPFLLYPWLYLVVFALANPLIFRWYLNPPMPALMLGILAGAWALIGGRYSPHLPTSSPSRRGAEVPSSQGEEFSVRAKSRIPTTSIIVMAALGILWLFMSVNAWELHPNHGPDRPAPKMAWHDIELKYQQIGALLRDKYGVTAETRVGSADIGAVGYFSRATIVDTVGLVTPELRRYYPFARDILASDQNYAIPPQLILDTQPAFLVTMEGFVREGLNRNPTFTSEYELVEEIPTGYYGRSMQLYRRRQSPSPLR